ncbi:LytR/AlgR family response regulator transcription factor [Paraclostridium bifermentans]|uniref:LytR/AlgR family response regulator transcription factor n=1 Tax=Paraclostridium bifermentans TaxID=1490 RepID=UPI003D271263
MIKIVICEDNFSCREKLKENLEIILNKLTNQFEIIVFNCGEDLIDNYPEDVDIFLLDIQMKKLTGMGVAKKIREKDKSCEIIFITGLIDYVQNGYEVRAYRYLLKPIKLEDLKKHIISCIKQIYERRENYLIIKNQGMIKKIKIHEILFLEVINRDILIHTGDQTYTTKTSMKNLEKELSKFNFFRCHNSFLINLKYIDCIQKNIVLINNEEIPISRQKADEFKNKFLTVAGDVIC